MFAVVFVGFLLRVFEVNKQCKSIPSAKSCRVHNWRQTGLKQYIVSC